MKARLISIGCCDESNVPTGGPASRMVASTKVAASAVAVVAAAPDELSVAALRPSWPKARTVSSTTNAALPCEGVHPIVKAQPCAVQWPHDQFRVGCEQTGACEPPGRLALWAGLLLLLWCSVGHKGRGLGGGWTTLPTPWRQRAR